VKYDTIQYNTKAMIEGVAVEGHHPSHHLYLTSPTHLKSLPIKDGHAEFTGVATGSYAPRSISEES